MDISVNIEAGQRYVVITNTITYNAVVYAIGDQFIGVAGVTTYTGSGGACEIIQANESGIEVTSFDANHIFPEQLTVQDASTEIIQAMNGTIYPDRLTLMSGGIEVSASRKKQHPQIMDSIN